MRTDQIEGILAGKSKSAQIAFSRKNVPEFGMVIFNGAFLGGLHGVTEKDTSAARVISAGLHTFGGREFRSPIRQKDAHIFVEQCSAQDRLQIVHPLDHFIRSFMIVVNSEKEGEGQELERLNERTVTAVIVYRIHLNDRRIRVFSEKSLKVSIGSTLQIGTVFPLFVLCGSLFGEFPASLTPQVHIVDIRKLKDTALNIVVKGLFADIPFRMQLNDGIG